MTDATVNRRSDSWNAEAYCELAAPAYMNQAIMISHRPPSAPLLPSNRIQTPENSSPTAAT